MIVSFSEHLELQWFHVLGRQNTLGFVQIKIVFIPANLNVITFGLCFCCLFHISFLTLPRWFSKHCRVSLDAQKQQKDFLNLYFKQLFCEEPQRWFLNRSLFFDLLSPFLQCIWVSVVHKVKALLMWSLLS